MDSTTPPQLLSAEEQEQRANQLNSDQQQRQLEEKEQERTEANERTDQLNDAVRPVGKALSVINSRKIRSIEKEIIEKNEDIKKAVEEKNKLARKLLRKQVRIFFEAISGIGIPAAIGEFMSFLLKSEEIKEAVAKVKKLTKEEEKLETKKYNLENLFKRQEEA